MDFFYAVHSAELTPLKTELVDLISTCLLKEPPYEAVRPEHLSLQSASSSCSSSPSHTSSPDRQPEKGKASQPPPSHAPPPPPVNEGVALVAQIRELVHLISRQDGEFVLKLALYTRHTLHLRSSPNYLVALCAREPNCLLFLQPYMEKIVVLPSDWLAIASFAYFYDCDAAHDYASLVHRRRGRAGRHEPAHRSRTASASGTASLTKSESGAGSRGPSAPSSRTAASRRPAAEGSTERKQGKKKQRAAQATADPTRSYLPAALRSSLVACFKKFTPFQLAKYDNEAAEHRAHRQERKRLLRQREQEQQRETSWVPSRGSEAESSTDSDVESRGGSSEDDGEEKAPERKDAATAASMPPRRTRRRTFTYKLLLRLLHITEPAFLVCCLLGKRYPESRETFVAMGLHRTDPAWRPPSVSLATAASPAGNSLPSPARESLEQREGEEMEENKFLADAEKETEATTESNIDGTAVTPPSSAKPDAPLPYCVFDKRLAGTRMRLPVATTWETQLSKDGNRGRVWDRLIHDRAVPYMALLRNLRNLLTRTCAAATHRRVLEKLVDASQIAASQQLPYRFYSAFLAVAEVKELVALLNKPRPSEPESGGRARGLGRGRGRGGREVMSRGRGRGRGPMSSSDPESSDDRVRAAYASFENPVATKHFIHKYLTLYAAALDAAISTAARLNVIPMKGTAVLILCVTQSLLQPMTATGAQADVSPASIQRKLDVAAILIAMMQRSCEQCVVLLYCYDEYVVFREEDAALDTAAAGRRRGEGGEWGMDRFEDTEEEEDESSNSRRSSGSGGADERIRVNEDGNGDEETRRMRSRAGDSRFRRVGSSSTSSTSSTTTRDVDDVATSRPRSARGTRGFMHLVTALTNECTRLLRRKANEQTASGHPERVATSFDMFAEGSDAQFPYAFLDEVMERHMRVESLLVLDEGVHRTYAHMNRNAPAFGDLPTYLSRLRRTCSPDIVYVGVNLKAANPPSSFRCNASAAPAVAAVTPDEAKARDAAQLALRKATVKQRFDHYNDILITGFSDAIMRLVAERTGGGPLSVIERAAETFHVARTSARAGQDAWAERAKALKIVTALRENESREASNKSVDRAATPPAASQELPGFPTEGAVPHIKRVTTSNDARGAVASLASEKNTSSSVPAGLSPPPFPTNIQRPANPSVSPASSPTLPRAPLSGSAVALPFFDKDGKAVSSTGWEMEWGHRARRSERQLQLLTGSSTGLTSAAASASSLSSRGTERGLPSIRRLFSKRATLDAEHADLDVPASLSAAPQQQQQQPHGHHDSHRMRSHATPPRAESPVDSKDEAAAAEAAWLTQQGKQASPVFHPRPFISLVKLLSSSANVPPAPSSSSGAVHRGAFASSLAATSRDGELVSPATAAAHATQKPVPHVDPNASPSSSSTRRPHSNRQGKHGSATSWRVQAASSPATPGSPLTVVRRLLTSYRVCRFFISSTFLDMNNERNALTLDIFPRLRRWAAEAGLKATLLEVDLRWGIPAVATTRNLSTSVCLNEVSRCSPFFLGMIGARYGSCPPTPLQLVVDEDVDTEDYAWMTELADPHVSVTELEMRHAMFTARRRCGNAMPDSKQKNDAVARAPPPVTNLFFARDSAHLMATFDASEVACRAVYEGDSPSAAASIAALKARIKEGGGTITDYKAEYLRSSRRKGRAGGASGDANAIHGGTSVTGAPDSALESGAGSTRALSGGVTGNTTNAALSSTQAMLEDDLGRWAVRGGRALDVVGPTNRTGGDTAESLWSFVTSRIMAQDTPKPLTSMDVPLDMSDFSAKVFRALQEVIRRVCGATDEEEDGAKASTAAAASARGQCQEGTSEARKGSRNGGACEDEQPDDTPSGFTQPDRAAAATPLSSPLSASSPSRAPTATAAATAASPTTASAPDLYETLLVTQNEFGRKLSALYAAPRGLLEQLSSFALAGTVDASTAAASVGPLWRHGAADKKADDAASATRSASPCTRRETGSINALSERDGMAAATRSSECDAAVPQPHHRAKSSDDNHRSRPRRRAPPSAEVRSILLLEGHDGDGKSSALAALTMRILLPLHDSIPVLFYSTQAGDDTVRALLLFLAISLRFVFHLYGEVTVQESDTVEQLLLALDQAYAAIHRRYASSSTSLEVNTARSVSGESRPAALVVMLDGLDKSSEAAELVSLLGTILHPLASPHIRFLVSACPRSPLAAALRARRPAAQVLPLPLLSEPERAQLVRLQLAAYGKLLEESFTADELKELLRKGGAGRPSCLLSAITYLRLFSTFDTLREDIRTLPPTAAQLYVKFFQQLQTRFDGPTCRLVLTLLLLRQPVGGVMEYNLYRLASNVAVASRLVALLRGICVDFHHGRLRATSAAFTAAIAHTYFPFASDYQTAQERVLVAELRYRPVDMSMDEQQVRVALRRITESIERNAVDVLAPRTFVPERYAPRELLGILQGSIQASRLDVTAALVCYLPFLECLLVNRRVLAQLIALLSALLHATTQSIEDSTTATSSSSMCMLGGAIGGIGGDADDLSSEADAAWDNHMNTAGVAATALHWRHYRNEVRRISGVLDFLQKHYHILLRQPHLLRQCVWNTVAAARCISEYDAASTARVQQALQEEAPLAAAVKANGKRESASGQPQQPQQQAQGGRRDTPTQELQSDTPETPPSPEIVSTLSTLWVHWINQHQHGGEARVMLTTASPLPIRCMAISPNGLEVALGSDDGVVRRISSHEEDQPQTPSLPSSAASQREAERQTGGGQRRVASTLRHESAVTAIRYVPPFPVGTSPFISSGRGGCLVSAGPPTSTSGGAATTTATSSSYPGANRDSDMSQLLVTGCARGIVYVWNLQDNSLLQRGTGHLRHISGFTSHPLESSVLVSCSHDSYVMLWNLCGTTSRLSEDVTSTLRLRLPKYPAGSFERKQQEGQLRLCGAERHGPRRGVQALQQSSLAAGSTTARPAFLTPLAAFHVERQHQTPVACVGFHRSGDIFASGGWDGALVLHNTRELCTPPPLLPYDATLPSSPPKEKMEKRGGGRRNRIANCGGGGVSSPSQAWRPRHGPEYRQLTYASVAFDLGAPVRALCFVSSLAVTCVVGCHNGSVNVIDHASASVVARWTSLHTSPITCLAPSPDGRCIASADEHGVVRLIHTGITGSVFATLSGHHGAVTGLCFRVQTERVDSSTAPASRQPMLLTAGDDRTLQAWRVSSRGSLGSGGEHETAAAATSSSSAFMRRRTLTASHSAAVTAVASSEDGRLLVTGSVDGTAIVFQRMEDDEDTGGGGGEWVGSSASDTYGDGGDAFAKYGQRGRPSRMLLLRGGAGTRGLNQGLSSFSSMTSELVSRPMRPAFVLRHDDGRISRIRFALRDTRIVVGMVSGLVYVWSSSPGLNRIEGRLLLRVRVPEHGLYPVVSLGVQDVPEESRSTATSTRVMPTAERQTYGGMRAVPGRGSRGTSAGDATARLDPSTATLRKADVDNSGEREGSTVVTAVCANGDVAVLKLLNDATSVVMAADRDRRRHDRQQQQKQKEQQRRRRTRRTGNNAATLSYNSSASRSLRGPETRETSSDFSATYAADEKENPAKEYNNRAGAARLGFLEETRLFPEEPLVAATKQTVVNSCTEEEPASDLAALFAVLDAADAKDTADGKDGTMTYRDAPHALVQVLANAVKDACAPHRPLDRRAHRLQRLLHRCAATEVALRESFQLDLRRHRMRWATPTEAAEIIAVVWLDASLATDAHQSSVPENRRRRLALVVTQRQLCLALYLNERGSGSEAESCASDGLHIRLQHGRTSDTAAVLDVHGALPEEGATAPGQRHEASADEETKTPAAKVPSQEFEVDMQYILQEDESFTSASAAVAVSPLSDATAAEAAKGTSPSTLSRHAGSAFPRRDESAVTATATASANDAYVVALTTNRGDVIVLRVQVPFFLHHCQRERRPVPSSSASDSQGEGGAAQHQLITQVLPHTRVYLCKRLCFYRPPHNTDGAAETVARMGEAEAGPAAPQRTSLNPLATSVQLSVLPDLTTGHGALQPPHSSAPTEKSESSTENIVDWVTLFAGCSDGSTRVWRLPAVPTEDTHTGRRSSPPKTARNNNADLRPTAHAALSLGCFFCSSAVRVVSGDMETRALPPAAKQHLSSLSASQDASSLLRRPLARWAVGDTLGNVYQVQLEKDAPGAVTALTQPASIATPSLLALTMAEESANARPWTWSLQRLRSLLVPSSIASCPYAQSGRAAMGRDGSSTNTVSAAGNAHESSNRRSAVTSAAASVWATEDAQTSTEWWTSVNFQTPISSILLKRSMRASSSSAGASSLSTQAVATGGGPEKEAAPKGAPQGIDATVALPSFDTVRNAVPQIRGLPPAEWSFLPRVPPVLRGASEESAGFATVQEPSVATGAGASQNIRATAAFGGVTMEAPMPGTPAALPSLGASLSASNNAQQHVLDSQRERPVMAPLDVAFQTPLKDLLAAYRTSAPLPSTSNEYHTTPRLEEKPELTAWRSLSAPVAQLSGVDLKDSSDRTATQATSALSFLAPRVVKAASATKMANSPQAAATTASSVRFELPPPPPPAPLTYAVPSEPSTGHHTSARRIAAPSRGEASRTTETERPPSYRDAKSDAKVEAAAEESQEADAQEEEEDYFAPLYKAGPTPIAPSASISAAAHRQAWWRHQQEVLKEAMRVQRYNREARAALKAYQERLASAAQMQ